MSRMRQAILEQLRIWGNQSGCHQRPERSFFYKGKQFPVCARCTGVSIGQLTAVLLFFVKRIHLLWAVLCIGIMGMDWGLQEFGIKESNNTRRLLTGFLGGFGLFSIYGFIIRKLSKLFL